MKSTDALQLDREESRLLSINHEIDREIESLVSIADRLSKQGNALKALNAKNLDDLRKVREALNG